MTDRRQRRRGLDRWPPARRPARPGLRSTGRERAHRGVGQGAVAQCDRLRAGCDAKLPAQHPVEAFELAERGVAVTGCNVAAHQFEVGAFVAGVEVGDVLPAFVEAEELEVELVELLAARCRPVLVAVLREQLAAIPGQCPSRAGRVPVQRARHVPRSRTGTASISTAESANSSAVSFRSTIVSAQACRSYERSGRPCAASVRHRRCHRPATPRRGLPRGASAGRERGRGV